MDYVWSQHSGQQLVQWDSNYTTTYHVQKIHQSAILAATVVVKEEFMSLLREKIYQTKNQGKYETVCLEFRLVVRRLHIQYTGKTMSSGIVILI